MNNKAIPKKWGGFDVIILVVILGVAIITSAVFFIKPEKDPPKDLLVSYTVKISYLPDNIKYDDNGNVIQDSYWNLNSDIPIFLFSNGNRSFPIGTVVYVEKISPSEKSIDETLTESDKSDYLDSGNYIDIFLKIEAKGYFNNGFCYIYSSNEESEFKIVGGDSISICTQGKQGFVFENATIVLIEQTEIIEE